MTEGGPIRIEGMGWRVGASILTVFGSAVVLILWLFFYAGSFSVYQNLAVIAAIALSFVAIMGATWAPWGMRQSGALSSRGGSPPNAQTGAPESGDWRRFLRAHGRAVAVFVVACTLALAGAVYVFLWFVKDSQTTGLVPSSLGGWTLANAVTFVLYAAFWEVVLVGIPMAVAGVIGWQWWRRLPSEERRSYGFFGNRSRGSRGGGASLFFFVAFCIKVYVDGNWNVPIATWTLDYVVNSMIIILMSCLVIFGIPLAIGAAWWIRREMRKPS